MTVLPQRPRGVRKHWKREVMKSGSIFERFASASRRYGLAKEWGDPVEMVVFSYAGGTKRVIMAYQNGRTTDISLYKNGTWQIRL